MTDISGMPQPVRLARHAMATRFEWVLWGQAPERLRAAGEEALDEVDALESALSRYRELSDIARVNASAAVGPVRVSPSTFRLLERARVLSEATERAFDITVGALLRVWGFVGGTGSRPLPQAVRQAVRQARDAAVVGPEAAVSDALSTALLVLGPEGRPLIEANNSGYRCIHLE
jgi:thiamine biosynthesis lipoprotein